MKRLFIAILVPLAACTVPEPLETPGRGSWLVRATEPIYQYRANGQIAATSCETGRLSGYSNAPSGCIVDSALAAQVVNPQDMVNPRQPGPPYAAPSAAAAYDYLYGRETAAGDTILTLDGTNGGEQGGGQIIPIPPAGGVAPAP